MQHPVLWRTLADKALKSAALMFYNEDNVLAAWRRIGLPLSDAQRYAHFGCNWPTPGDHGAWMQGGPRSDKYGAYRSREEQESLAVPYMRANAPHSWPEDFVIVMRTLAARDPEAVTIEDFYTLFFARMRDFIRCKLRYLSRELAVRRRRPAAVLTFGDCFLEGSLKTATCCSAGAKYQFELQSFQMFGTVADCFIAVDQLVMREKKLTLLALLRAVETDFRDAPQVLALCRHAEKYGMDTPLSNSHAERLAETASALVIEESRPYLAREGLLLLPCMQSDTWHLKLGEQFGATPDGRRAHMPFSQNARPANGAAVNGLTAMLRSMLHLPRDGLLSGALNLDVDPKQFEGEAGKEIFAALLATYLREGGLHAQVTAADVTALLDAQKNPHLYRDIRVRVTGYSGVFVDICRRLQDDIISRMK